MGTRTVRIILNNSKITATLINSIRAPRKVRSIAIIPIAVIT